MPVTVILAISILVHVAAACLALRLIAVTGRRMAWVLIATGISLLAAQRMITLVRLLSDDQTHPPEPAAELVALAISVLMAGGIAWIAPAFRDITERKRAEEALRETNETLTVLTEVSRAIAASRTPEELSETLACALRSVTHVDAFVLDAVDVDTGVCHEVGNFDTIDGRFQRVPSAPEPYDWRTGSRGGPLFERREPVLIQRSEEEVASPTDLQVPFGDASRRSASLIFVPLIVGERATGVLSVQSYTLNAYGTRDVELLAAVGRQVAPAVEGVLLSHRLSRSAEALRESEDRYRSIVENSSELIMLTKPDGVIAYLSPACEKVLGWQPKDLVGRQPWIIHSEDLEMVKEYHFESLKGGSGSDVEYRIQTKAGRTKWVGHAWAPVFADDKLNMIVNVVRDISDRKQAEEAVRVHTQRLETLRQVDWAILEGRSPEEIAGGALSHLRQLVPCDGCGVAVFTSDQQQAQVLAVNLDHETTLSAGTMISLQNQGAFLEELGRREVVYAEDLATLDQTAPVVVVMREAGMRSWMSAPLVAEGELIGCLTVGAARPYAFTGEHGDIANEVATVLAVAIQQSRLHEHVQRQAAELGERVAERTAELDQRVAQVEQLNDALANLLDDLRSANRNLETTSQQLRETNLELESFAYSVSHDLRAPLRAMEGFAGALSEDYAGRLDAVGQDYARRIVDAAARMNLLIEDLLAYSQLGRSDIEFRPVSLERAVNEAFGRLEAEIREKGAQVTVESPLPTVTAHGATLDQVIANLVSNAVKFVAPGVKPEVRLRAKRRGDVVRLCVEDNGIGISPDHQERIFEVFERLHGIETYPGTGIGLAIVRKAVERMGGRVGVESAEGEGSRFWVELGGA